MYNVELPHMGHDVDGGYLTEDCTILAQGVWNGITYTPLELAKAANKWRDNTVWNRHYEGKQRDESNRIGVLKNIHFDDHRIAADVFLSTNTPEGRDMIELVKDGKVNGISVEHVDIEVDGVATNIQFLGAAIVPEPACRVCSLSQKEAKAMEDKEIKELQKKVAELGATQDKVVELEATIKELKKIDVDSIVSEQSRKDQKVISALETRVKELEDTPQDSQSVATDLVDSYAGLAIDPQGISRRI